MNKFRYVTNILTTANTFEFEIVWIAFCILFTDYKENYNYNYYYTFLVMTC